MAAVASFSRIEILAATVLAGTLEAAIFVVLALSANETKIVAKEAEAPKEVPIEVQPVLDLPLLKKGSKKKPKLPDMWTRKPPIKRYEAKSAPTPKAEDRPPEEPSEAPLLKEDEEPPPPDASLAKKVDEDIPDTEEMTDDPNLPGEGSPDGVDEGTETDPLKAFAISQYKVKISSWFNVRFKRPTGDEIPCEELKTLRASVVASITGERTVGSYSIVKPSGNALFDQRVQATLDAIVAGGAQLPPPPPKYPDILESNINVGFFVPTCD